MKVSRTARGLLGLLMAGTTLGVGGVAMAATAAETTSVEEVVVTANKRAENIQIVPSSVSAVSEGLIQRVQATNLTDISAYVPGLNVQSSGVSANRVVIRGLSTGPNDLSPSTGIYLDDAPFGSNSGFALGALFSPDVDPFDLDRIEVLRGPQGTLYGASTLAGLVKYVTKQPDLHDFQGHIRVDFTDVDRSGANGGGVRGGVNIPIIDDKVALRVSGFWSHNQGDAIDVRTGRENLNSQTKEGGRAALLIRPTDNLSIDAILVVDHSDVPHIGTIDGNAVTLEPIYGDRAGFNYVDGFARSNYALFEGNIRYELPNGISITSTTSLSRLAVNELADDTNVFAPAFGPFLGPLLEWAGPVKPTTRKGTEEIRIASPSNHHFEWLLGGFYDHESSTYISNITSTYLYGATPPAFLQPIVDAFANYESVTNKTRYIETAVFGNATYYLTDDFDIGAGVRYSHNSQHRDRTASGYLVNIGVLTPAAQAESEDGVWTEAFSARWRFTPDDMLYGRISRGYRPGGPNTVGGNFEPDTTWNYETGLKLTGLDGRLTADIAAFWIDWSNIQLNFFNGTNTIIGNAGDATSKGVEFEGTLTPVTGLTFAANLAYTDAKISGLIPGAQGGAVVGDTLPYSSKWAGAIRGDYVFPLNDTLKGNVGGAVRYKSAFNTTFPGDPGTRFYRLPSTTFFDLRAGIGNDRWNLDLQVLNVFDVHKLASASEFLAVPAAAADAYGQPVALGYTPGRTYGVSLSAHF